MKHLWISFRDYIYESTLTTTTSYSFSFHPGKKASSSPPPSPPYEKPPPRRSPAHPPKLSDTRSKGSTLSAEESMDSTSATFGSNDAPCELTDDLICQGDSDLENGNRSGHMSNKDGKNKLRKNSRKSRGKSNHPYYNIPPSGSQSGHSYYNVPLHGKTGSPPRGNSQLEHPYYNVPPYRAPRISRQNAKDPMVHRHTPPYTLDDSLPKYRNYRQISLILQEDLEKAVLKAKEELYLSEKAIPVLSHTDSVDQRGLVYLPRQNSYDRWSQTSCDTPPLPYTPIQSFEYDSVPLSPTFTRFKPPTPPLPRKHFDGLIIPDPPSEPAPRPPVLVERSTSWPSALAGAGRKKKLRVRFSETEIIIPPEPEPEYQPEVQEMKPEVQFRNAEDGASVNLISASQDVLFRTSLLV